MQLIYIGINFEQLLYNSMYKMIFEYEKLSKIIQFFIYSLRIILILDCY